MPKLPAVQPKKLIRVLLRLGFYRRHSVGSHQVFKHPDGRRTTVAVHNREIPKGTLKAILNDLKLTTEEFVKEL